MQLSGNVTLLTRVGGATRIKLFGLRHYGAPHTGANFSCSQYTYSCTALLKFLQFGKRCLVTGSMLSI